MANYSITNDNTNSTGGLYTVNPDASADGSVGWQRGGEWLNTTTGVTWTCLDATQGAAVWAPSDFNEHPGYVTGANMLYLPVFAGAAGTGATVANSIRVFPAAIKGRIALTALIARISALVAGNVSLAVYTTKNGRPGLLVANTANIVASVGVLLSPPVQGNVVVNPGVYWFATNSDNTSGFYTALSTQLAATGLIGTTSTANIMTGAGYVSGLATPQAFGTWPTDLSGAPWSELTAAPPLVAFKVG